MLGMERVRRRIAETDLSEANHSFTGSCYHYPVKFNFMG